MSGSVCPTRLPGHLPLFLEKTGIGRIVGDRRGKRGGRDWMTGWKTKIAWTLTIRKVSQGATVVGGAPASTPHQSHYGFAQKN